MTRPLRHILLTGATGYIGRRLLQRLADDPDVRLRVLVRNRTKLPQVSDRLQVIEGSTFDPAALAEAVRGIDMAYYLIHSMGQGTDFEAMDRASAHHFLDACVGAGVRRIVYLGGLGRRETASPHLRSRMETGAILSSRPDRIQTIHFRAGVIIGSGSTSFEIIRHLVQKLPVMVTPRWVSTRTQPIGVSDVLAYLQAARTLAADRTLEVDIGGEQMTFGEMMLATGRAMGLRRWIIRVPVLTPKLSSYWLILFTPVPYRLAAALIEGLRSETVVTNDLARQLFPLIPTEPFALSVRTAIAEIEQRQVISRWSDSSGEIREDPNAPIEKAVFQDRRSYAFRGTSKAAVYRAFTSIGGEHGWFSYNILWRIRGLVDKLAGGYGLNRGRRDPESLRIGDSIDFWTVADLVPGRRLLLQAQMKLPGRAWLEFLLTDHELVQTAYYYPNGLWGRLYWYLVLPFHGLVFRKMGRSIIREGRRLEAAAPRSRGGD
jgi:uncharacterized protein YbjT (DUF2867 family)